MKVAFAHSVINFRNGGTAQGTEVRPVSAIFGDETLTRVDHLDGLTSFQLPNGKWLCVEVSGLFGQRDTNTGPWERFERLDVNRFREQKKSEAPNRPQVVIATITLDASSSSPLPPSPFPPTPLPPSERRGTSRLEGKKLVDDAGAYLANGATFFWLPWGLEFDRQRTLENLNYLRDRGVHAVRILCVVGWNGSAEQDSWSDRTINPATLGWDRWQGMISRTLATLREFNMRAIVTIFGGIEKLSLDDRQRVVELLRGITDKFSAQVVYIEISNESKIDTPEARSYARMFPSERIVAITAGQIHDSKNCLIPLHLERKVTGDGGVWDYTEQGYDFNGYPQAGSDQEPIGPDSSVAEDDDPARLTSEAATSLICGAPVVVMHCGAGIRGGGAADRKVGRHENFWQYSTLNAILAGRLQLTTVLPQDVASFGSVCHSNPRCQGVFPWDTGPLQPYDPASWFLKIYAATHQDGRIAANFMKISRDIPLKAMRNQEFTIYAIEGGEGEKVRLSQGETYTIRQRGGVYLTGRYL